MPNGPNCTFPTVLTDQLPIGTELIIFNLRIPKLRHTKVSFCYFTTGHIGCPFQTKLRFLVLSWLGYSHTFLRIAFFGRRCFSQWETLFNPVRR